MSAQDKDEKQINKSLKIHPKNPDRISNGIISLTTIVRANSTES
jgi:hypothetical protein